MNSMDPNFVRPNDGIESKKIQNMQDRMQAEEAKASASKYSLLQVTANRWQVLGKESVDGSGVWRQELVFGRASLSECQTWIRTMEKAGVRP